MAVVCRIPDILGRNRCKLTKPPAKTGGLLFFSALGTQFGLIDFIDKTVGYFHYRCYFVRDLLCVPSAWRFESRGAKN